MRKPSYAEYEQSTGLFEIWAFPDDGGASRCFYQAVGYAGRRSGKNRPSAQFVRGLGPLPEGTYRLGEPYNHPRLGPLAFPLYPHPSNEMGGRSGFFIHGDSKRNPGQASSGCIILNRAARDAILEYCVRHLIVHPGVPATPALAGTGTVTK